MATRTRRAKPGRHERTCRLCNHLQRERIEGGWIAWANTSRIAKENGLSRDTIYRYVDAFNLRERRGKNLRAALERIIEQADTVTVNASAVVAAIAAFSKINAAGQWVDRTEQVDLNDLFGRMGTAELEQYAREGTLPQWFSAVVGATPADCQEDRPNGHGEQSQRETD